MTEAKTKKLPLGKVTFLALALILIIGAFTIVGDNELGYSTIVKYPNGSIRVITDTGPYVKAFGQTIELKMHDEFYFSPNKEEGGDNFYSKPIPVTFADKGKGTISGFVKYSLPMDVKKLEELATRYGSSNGIKDQIIRQHVAEVLSQSAQLMTSEEADVLKKSEYKDVVTHQIQEGLYKKYVDVITVQDLVSGEPVKQTITKVRTSKDGNPVVSEISPLKKWAIYVDDVKLQEPDWDDQTEKILMTRKAKRMETLMEKEDALKAVQTKLKQEALKDAAIAKVQADMGAKKEQARIAAEQAREVAVIEAKRKKEVAALEKAEADLKAAAIERMGLAQAKVDKAKRMAGLSPLQKAEIEAKMKVAMMEAWAKRPVPSSIISTGSTGKNGATSAAAELMSIRVMQDMLKTKVEATNAVNQ